MGVPRFKSLLHHYFASFSVDIHILHVVDKEECKMKKESSLEENDFFPQGATPVKFYHSAVPHENSAFKNFAYVSWTLHGEQISCIVSYISYLIQSVTRVRHLRAQNTILKLTISCRRVP